MLFLGDRDVIASLLRVMDADPSTTLARAEGDENRARLRAQTDRARALGLFGAPTFVVDGELFWGNDRLGDAISWALLGGRGPGATPRPQ